MARILVVEDDPSILSLLTSHLKKQGDEVIPVADGQKAMKLLDEKKCDLLITDVRMSPVSGMDLLNHARQRQPEMAVIMMTGHGTVETAVKAMKSGAFDYITKPFKVDEMLLTVRRALEYQHALAENIELRAQLQDRFPFENMVAVSASMRGVCEMISRVAPSDTTVLIQGESGTGKELVARAIHASSNRKGQKFIAINCAALPEPLLESELFGHIKGSFTGASSDKVGLFEAANQGTLLLDEIGAMPLALQGKLLRVLEQKEVRRVGDTETRAIHVRVLAATNERLEKLMAKERFREDLYYRLNVITIDIPPLRERREDILPLVEFLLRRLRGADAIPAIDQEAELVLERYHWPGNIRELDNAIRHACTFFQGDRIARENLPARIVHAADRGFAALDDGRSDEEFKVRSLKAFLRDKEKAYVRQVIDAMGGDKRKAADALKVSLATLYRKLPELEE